MPRSASRRLSRLSLLAVAAVGLPLAAAGSASAAGYDDFDCNAAPNGVCVGSPNLVRSVFAYTDTNARVGTGASPTGSISDLVGGRFNFSEGYSCTSFSGASVLYPIVANGSPTSTLPLVAVATFGPGADTC